MIHFKGAVLNSSPPALLFVTRLISISTCMGLFIKHLYVFRGTCKNKKSARKEEREEEIIYLNAQQRRKMDVQHQEPFTPSRPKDK